MPFNPEKMRKKHMQFVETHGDELISKLGEEIEYLQGFDESLLTEYSGTTEQLNDILTELETAMNQNLTQAQLKQNLINLGDSTYQLARKITDLIP
ncbi:hypothetical protein [Planctobacterium marinum]|uniref:Uncharacterized protein n=1 Tax=Planctobacterium marinum TaxID=1631968 RepID=A0AA48KMW3_9ALTE|nr:hypothetical protein MACH26_03820 [Planctobacterium marinum]